MGPYALTLIAANALLIVVQAYAWFAVFLELGGEARSQYSARSQAAVAIWIGLFVPVFQQTVMAQNLVYTLLPIFLIVVWLSTHNAGRRAYYQYAGAALLGSAMLLTHNASIVFIVSAVLLIVLLGKNPLGQRIFGGIVILTVSLLAWVACREYLDQSGSHPLVRGRYTFFENIRDAAEGLGAFFFLQRFGYWVGLLLFPGLVAYLLYQANRKGVRFAVLFSVSSSAMYIALFCLVWLNGTISDPRHLLFAPLLIVPLLLNVAARKNTLAFAAIAILVFPYLLYQHAVWDFERTGHVPALAQISRISRSEERVVVDGVTLIGPIEWEEPMGGYSSTGTPQWGPSQKHLQ